MSDFNGLGLAMGVVRGVRAFDVDSLGRLGGVNYSHIWKPGENNAKCLRKSALDFSIGGPYIPSVVWSTGRASFSLTSPKIPAPAVEGEPHPLTSCTCGFYAFYDGSNDYRSDQRISGVVEGYGETLIGTRGFRSKKARIVALCIPEGKKARGRWADRHPTIRELVSLFPYALGTSFMVQAVIRALSAQWALCLILMVVGGVVWTGLHFALRPLLRKSPPNASALAPDKAARVRENYPDVPVFSTFDAMVKAFPPDKGEQPSPATDPEFWERRA